MDVEGIYIQTGTIRRNMASLKNEHCDPAIQAELNALDWKHEILPRALKYAKWASWGLQRRGYIVEPEDLVHEAIDLVFRGRRKWDRTKVPDFVAFLKGVIKSQISHIAEHAKKFPTDSLVWDEGDQISLAIAPDGQTVASSLVFKPADEAFLQAEQMRIVNNMLDLLEEESEEMGLLVICTRDEITKPREIAEVTGLDIKKVYKLKERLSNRLKQSIYPQKGGK